MVVVEYRRASSYGVYRNVLVKPLVQGAGRLGFQISARVNARAHGQQRWKRHSCDLGIRL